MASSLSVRVGGRAVDTSNGVPGKRAVSARVMTPNRRIAFQIGDFVCAAGAGPAVCWRRWEPPKRPPASSTTWPRRSASPRPKTWRPTPSRFGRGFAPTSCRRAAGRPEASPRREVFEAWLAGEGRPLRHGALAAPVAEIASAVAEIRGLAERIDALQRAGARATGFPDAGRGRALPRPGARGAAGGEAMSRRSARRGARVLVVDDQPRTAEILASLAPELELLPVRAPGEPRFHARSWREAAPLLEGRRAPDVVVLDLRFELSDEELLPDERPLGETAAARRLRRDRRDRQGLFILERLRRRRPGGRGPADDRLRGDPVRGGGAGAEGRRLHVRRRGGDGRRGLVAPAAADPGGAFGAAAHRPVLLGRQPGDAGAAPQGRRALADARCRCSSPDRRERARASWSAT